MLARPWPSTNAKRLTTSPTKFVLPLGLIATTGATAFVDQTLVAASSKEVAIARLVIPAKKLVAPAACRNAYAVAAGGALTPSDDTIFGSAEEIGLIQSVAANESFAVLSVVGFHFITT